MTRAQYGMIPVILPHLTPLPSLPPEAIRALSGPPVTEGGHTLILQIRICLLVSLADYVCRRRESFVQPEPDMISNATEVVEPSPLLIDDVLIYFLDEFPFQPCLNGLESVTQQPQHLPT